ncbi:MAG: hypothetical protein HRT69_02600 [Flavobacteriaceae bacterium]|nr:hypothetical protein [Flavobacteriaceae bacterium]
MEEEYGFTISSGIVNEISYGNAVTYTMFVSREEKDPSFFENIVVSVDENNVTSAVLVKYNLNSEIVRTPHDDSYIMDAEIQITHIDYNNTESKISFQNEGDCVTILMCPWSPDGTGEAHVAGQSCIDANRTGDDAIYTILSDGCSNPGGGDGNDSNDDGSGSETSEHGSGSSTNTSSTPSWPVLDENGCNTTIKGLLSDWDLSYDEKCWLNSNGRDVKTALEQYLIAGGNDAFAQLAFEALDQDGIDDGEVDFDDEIILDQTILSNPKVLCVLNTLRADSYVNTNNDNTLFNSIIDNYFGSSKSAKIKFEIGNIPTQLGNGIDAFTYTDYNSTSPFLLNLHPGDVMTVRLNPTFVQNASTLEIALTLIHESIHAELFDRGIQLGLITEATPLGSVYLSLNSTAQTVPNMVFNGLMTQYYNFNGVFNDQWNHDLMIVLNYRTKMTQNLLSIHNDLNDINNDFLSNVNNDPNIIGGPYTLNQIMDYITWHGLDQTQEYINTINGTPEENKADYLINAARSKYTHNCN